MKTPAHAALTRSLVIFLSDRCNMACDYCHLDLNRGPATVLDLAAAKRAIDEHLARVPAGRACFVLLGGEPFVHYPLLQGIVDYLHGAAPEGTTVAIATNGTLLDADRIAALRRRGAALTVSLDGDAGANDRHRSLLSPGGGPALESILRRLAGHESDLQVNMTVCQDSVGSLLQGVETLRRRGFSLVQFQLNMFEDWSETGLQALESTARGIVRYCRAVAAASSRPPALSNLYAVDRGAPDRSCAAEDHPYEDLVLGADGRYYPCYGLFARPYRSLGSWAVGDADAGVDWTRRAGLLGRAQEFIHPRLERRFHYRCPREAYFHAQVTGRDPEAAVRAFHRADNILGDAFSPLDTCFAAP